MGYNVMLAFIFLYINMRAISLLRLSSINGFMESNPKLDRNNRLYYTTELLGTERLRIRVTNPIKNDISYVDTVVEAWNWRAMRKDKQTGFALRENMAIEPKFFMTELDQNGKIEIPKTIRDFLRLEPGDFVEVFEMKPMYLHAR